MVQLGFEKKTMDERLLHLQNNLDLLTDQLKTETEERETLEKKVEDLQIEVASMKVAASVILAKSIVSAAEARFVELICEGVADHGYTRVGDIQYDVESNFAPQKIAAKWKKHKDCWDARLLPRLIRDLTDSRGSVCHEEDRKPEKFETMSVKAIKEALSAVKLHPLGNPIGQDQIKALIKLHTATYIHGASATETDD